MPSLNLTFPIVLPLPSAREALIRAVTGHGWWLLEEDDREQNAPRIVFREPLDALADLPARMEVRLTIRSIEITDCALHATVLGWGPRIERSLGHLRIEMNWVRSLTGRTARRELERAERPIIARTPEPARTFYRVPERDRRSALIGGMVSMLPGLWMGVLFAEVGRLSPYPCLSIFGGASLIFGALNGMLTHSTVQAKLRMRRADIWKLPWWGAATAASLGALFGFALTLFGCVVANVPETGSIFFSLAAAVVNAVIDALGGLVIGTLMVGEPRRHLYRAEGEPNA